jgi:hypothetical protein
MAFGRGGMRDFGLNHRSSGLTMLRRISPTGGCPTDLLAEQVLWQARASA